jgi:hypothetical protein
MTPTLIPLNAKQGGTTDRYYLPTLNGDVVQIGAGRAVVLTLAVARDMHLPWVERMAGRTDVSFPDYWRRQLDDLRWAVSEAEAHLEALQERRRAG